MSDSVILAVVTITIPSVVASVGTYLAVRTRRQQREVAAPAPAKAVNWYRNAWLTCRSALRHLVNANLAAGADVPPEAFDALDLTPPELADR